MTGGNRSRAGVRASAHASAALDRLARAYIEAQAARGLCEAWFDVPTTGVLGANGLLRGHQPEREEGGAPADP